ncbi:helix-turn-helix domain-containing protein [Streptomyces griseus]|uniref:helix-turn-helix domain-containing protein n=1 Tax=Streptomyces griseus TaxID=1911 RepID=UPI003824DF56
MNAIPWRDRVRGEDELVEQLQLLVSESAKRRALALLDGVAELGTVADVARELGKSWNTVDKAIKRNGPGPTTE